ncbi:hypothetical protein ACQKP0_05270 [Heyndrickxia sp. NPDC080065]|uniref:hypothetical protein n=1 Tax=Heyndrickxia sp. NPDC080065 TaxID=3390568 RepID=UPI003CFBDF1B
MQRDESQRFTILLSSGIICILASFVLPLFLGSIIRDAFFKPKGAFAFSSDSASYFIFAGAFILIGILLILLAIDAIKLKIRIIISSILIVISAIMLTLSIDNYYYGTEKGFYANPLNSLGTTEILWKDISEMEQIYVKVNDNQEPRKLIFKLHDGSQVEINYNQYLYDARNMIEAYVKGYGGKSIITEKEENESE